MFKKFGFFGKFCIKSMLLKNILIFPEEKCNIFILRKYLVRDSFPDDALKILIKNMRKIS